MPDFTLNTFHQLLTSLKAQHYTFQTFAQFLKNPAPRIIILRHDVDARKMNSLQTAQIEKELGIIGTYYFRIVPESFDEDVVKQIANLGHEIGYHYEDMNRCAVQGTRYAEEELSRIAIESFKENLAKLRRVVPVETICMHGSPLSKLDNRKLWEKYNYREYGIIGEPYFDVDFNEVLYLTDTGRRWDGDAASVRDKAQGTERRAQSEESIKTKGLRDEETERRLDKEQPATSNQEPVTFKFHSTFDIIRSAESLPDKIMLTIHPQRWDGRTLPWLKELVWQNVKNIGKRFITSSHRNSAGESV